jgi:uncharacterized protein
VAESDELYFCRTQEGAELDLLFVRGRTRIGFELKRGSSPTVTPSMRHALTDLHLDRLYVIHAGEHRFAMQANIEAVPWTQLSELAQQLT